MSITAQNVGHAPTSPAAEWSVISRMLTQADAVGTVVGETLAAEDFSLPETRLLFSIVIDRHYSSKPVDPLVVGELARDDLANYWSADPSAVAELLVQKTRQASIGTDVAEHVAIVKRMSTNRKLLDACNHAMIAISENKMSPEEIGDRLGVDTLAATAGTVRRSELLDMMDVGRAYARHLQRLAEARSQGREIGVYTGLSFIDAFTSGIGPGELLFLAGEAGVGKTALAIEATLGFASRQMRQAPDRRMATLFLSCEMGLNSSTARVVTRLTGIDGMKLREGAIDKQQFQKILTVWKDNASLPIYWNFASNFKLSQLRALIAEAIRRYNVGFIVLDHFRMVDPDRRQPNALEADEVKVRFLKENIAKDLNVAVMCLAHTIKTGRSIDGPQRPRMSDLRGSGQIAANADFIAIAWNPNRGLSEDQMSGEPGENELVWAKNRYGDEAMAPYRFVADQMRVEAR